MANQDAITMRFELPHDEAAALSQLVKRVDYDTHAAPIRERHCNLQWPHRRSGQARRTNAALSAFAAEQRKAREALAWQRQREGTALADLKTERAALSAKGRWIETEVSADVVRTRVFVTDRAHWPEVSRAHGDVFREVRPAATCVVTSPFQAWST